MATVRIKGLSQTRRRIRQLPDDIKVHVQRAVEDGGNRVHRTARNLTPRGRTTRTASLHLRDTLGLKLSRDRLSVKVGWSERIIGKRLRKKGGWRAIFLLVGSRGGVVKRGPAKGAVIPPQRANNVLQKALEMEKNFIIRRVDAQIKQALREADSRGIR